MIRRQQSAGWLPRRSDGLAIRRLCRSFLQPPRRLMIACFSIPSFTR